MFRSLYQDNLFLHGYCKVSETFGLLNQIWLLRLSADPALDVVYCQVALQTRRTSAQSCCGPQTVRTCSKKVGILLHGSTHLEAFPFSYAVSEHAH